MSLQAEIEKAGFATVPRVLSEADLSSLCTLFASSSYGERNLLEIEEIRKLAVAQSVKFLATSVLGHACFAVRAILFDKNASDNWNVTWHQDRVIAVKHRVNSDSLRGWSVKAGVHHVQPPAEVVREMLALRLYLDDCGEGNGPLLVLPGSHNDFIGDDELETWKKREMVVCTAKRGDAILMRPLILHSSARSVQPHRRRVIHIEFASGDLPYGLEWHTKVA